MNKKKKIVDWFLGGKQIVSVSITPVRVDWRVADKWGPDKPDTHLWNNILVRRRFTRATSPSERINELPASASVSRRGCCGAAEPSHLFLLRKEAGGSRASVFLARSVVSVTQTRLAVAVVKTLSELDLSHNKGRGTRCSLLSAVPQREPARLAGVHKFDGRPTVNKRLANAATLARRRNT